ncbi:hypothetical protein ACFL0Z_00160 [Patescibacteria group bacterium]
MPRNLVGSALLFLLFCTFFLFLVSDSRVQAIDVEDVIVPASEVLNPRIGEGVSDDSRPVLEAEAALGVSRSEFWTQWWFCVVLSVLVVIVASLGLTSLRLRKVETN